MPAAADRWPPGNTSFDDRPRFHAVVGMDPPFRAALAAEQPEAIGEHPR